MKKLMIAAAIVCAAAMSQAATFNWTGSSVIYGADVTKVNGNGDVAASTTKARNDGTWSWVLSIYDSSSKELLESTSGTFTIPVSGKPSTGITSDLTKVGDGATVDYILTITGVQTSLRALGEKGEWDYSAATVEAALAGTVTTETMGTTAIGNPSPSTWTVKGATAVGPGPEPVPEPTSAMLLLLGMAGLALRRKQK